MATIPMYNVQGQEVGSLPLPDAIFGVAFNESLVHQALVTEEANKRQGTHNTKQRSDVRGGGRKPWKQKGTGRARQGTIRAPQWKGGGVVFGPHPRSYRKALPVKMRRGAMRSVLSSRVADGSMIGLDTFQMGAIKTKEALKVLQALNVSESRRLLVILPEYNETILKSLRNVPNVELRYAPNFSVRDAIVAHKIVLVQGAVSKIVAVWTPEKAKFGADHTTAATPASEVTEPMTVPVATAETAPVETASEAAAIMDAPAETTAAETTPVETPAPAQTTPEPDEEAAQ